MIKAGLMTPFGLEKTEEAKKNGQWDKAYGTGKMPEMPAEFKQALEKDIEAYSNFMNFAKSYQRNYLNWYISAKQPATKEKRLIQIVEWSKQNKKQGMM
ncbi:MAG: YdeI/OmpD-associated family protein [Chloroflexia bacterium]|nr:YdeI/OmpD-associated family protein [Chloroflexia bacterium]